MTRQNTKYPSTIYRVSLKAIIRNDRGQVLVVREGDGAWTLPGGGAEHGETAEETLKRELLEEANISAPFTYNALGTEPIFIEKHDTWIMWMVYDVKIDGEFTYGVTDEVQDIAFMDPLEFEMVDNAWERLIYKWSVKK